MHQDTCDIRFLSESAIAVAELRSWVPLTDAEADLLTNMTKEERLEWLRNKRMGTIVVPPKQKPQLMGNRHERRLQAKLERKARKG